MIDYEGFDVDLIRAIAEAMRLRRSDMSFRYYANPWTELAIAAAKAHANYNRDLLFG